MSQIFMMYKYYDQARTSCVFLNLRKQKYFGDKEKFVKCIADWMGVCVCAYVCFSVSVWEGMCVCVPRKNYRNFISLYPACLCIKRISFTNTVLSSIQQASPRVLINQSANYVWKILHNNLAAIQKTVNLNITTL